MKQRIRRKIFRNRWRLNYSLGQIFEASRGIVFWVYPGNGFKYFLNYHNGKIIKKEDDYYGSKKQELLDNLSQLKISL